MLPDGWKRVKIEDVFEETCEKNHPYAEVLTIIQGVGTVPRELSGREIVYDKNSLANYKFVKKGDFIIHLRSFEGGLEVANSDGIVSPAYIILHPKIEVSTKFLYALFHTNRFINQTMPPAVEGARDGRSVKYDVLKKQKILFPPLSEQEKIAEILATQDRVIELKEKLIAEKQSQKKYLMSVLLGDDFKKPFKLNGVTIDKKKWEKKQFERVLTFLRNNTFSRADMDDSQGQVKNVHYGDILVKYGTILDCDKELVPFLKKEKQNYSNIAYLEDGDIIIADTAEDETCGKMVEIIHKKNNLIVAGLHTIACRPANKLFASKWLGYYMNSPAYHNQLIPLITGIKVSSISKSAISITNIAIPSLPEQKVIADVLSTADEEISLLQKSLEQEKLKKKSLMQLLLTGLVRVNE